jgi:PAS domain S-box-containing protein
LQEGLIVGLANHTILVRKDGTEVPIDDSGAPIVTENGGAIRGVVLVFRDITERKKTEDTLQRQAALIDLSPDAIIVRKLDGTITFWSKGAEKLYGWTKEEAIGKSTHALFQTEFPEPFDDIVDELKAKKQWSGELVHVTKKGRRVTVQSWWLAEKTEHGRITSILESNVDLTQRKNSEKEIARLATFPMLNPSPVIEVDFKGQLTFVNPATKQFFPNLQTAGLKHEFFSNWGDIIETFKDKNANTFGREIKVGAHWYHQQFYLVPHTQDIRIYTTDIDELKQSEESRARAQVKLEENAVLLEEYASQMEELAEQRAQQLQNAERMAAIGQTAGMVGHDIRNPLQAITSDMYIIAEETKTMQDSDSKQAILESIESVNQNINYINKIVSDLQDYTRPLKPNLQDANLGELIEGTLLTIDIPKKIDVRTEIAADAKPIKTDVAYLRRILTNLLTNGVQAMPDEGRLTVKASKTENSTIITVQDTGVGIPAEAKEKMFTPLFTTKSKGQGLGLAVVKRLVSALGGKIGFASKENDGTTFTVELPQTEQF